MILSKKISGILQTIMLEPLLFTNILVGTETDKENIADILCYIFLPLTAVPSEC